MAARAKHGEKQTYKGNEKKVLNHLRNNSLVEQLGWKTIPFMMKLGKPGFWRVGICL